MRDVTMMFASSWCGRSTSDQTLDPQLLSKPRHEHPWGVQALVPPRHQGSDRCLVGATASREFARCTSTPFQCQHRGFASRRAAQMLSRLELVVQRLTTGALQFPQKEVAREAPHNWAARRNASGMTKFNSRAYKSINGHHDHPIPAEVHFHAA